MVAFSIGNVHVYWYGVFYALAFLISYVFFSMLGRKKVFLKYPKIHFLLNNHVDSLVLYCILGVLLGGRIGHILIYEIGYYIQNPIEMLQFRKGGMSFIGGMVGVSLAMFIFAQKNKLKRLEFLWILDLILAIAPLGIMMGRIGNFLNQELYGVVVPYDFWSLPNWFIVLCQKLQIFHVYDQVDSLLRLNTNFLASFFEGFVLLILGLSILRNSIKKGTYTVGLISGVFLLGYTIVRFLLEYLRSDSQAEFVFRFTKSQRFFMGFFLLGLYFVFFRRNKITIK